MVLARLFLMLAVIAACFGLTGCHTYVCERVNKRINYETTTATEKLFLYETAQHGSRNDESFPNYVWDMSVWLVEVQDTLPQRIMIHGPLWRSSGYFDMRMSYILRPPDMVIGKDGVVWEKYSTNQWKPIYWARNVADFGRSVEILPDQLLHPVHQQVNVLVPAEVVQAAQLQPVNLNTLFAVDPATGRIMPQESSHVVYVRSR